MAKKRKRRRGGGQRRQRGSVGVPAVVGALVFLVAEWSLVWPYLLGLAVAGTIGGTVTALVMRGRREAAAEKIRREEMAQLERERSMTVVDAMTGDEFELHVAALCRRDGCTRVVKQGGRGDRGADVVGLLPDGRRLVIQLRQL